jgi:hypothetical protein
MVEGRDCPQAQENHKIRPFDPLNVLPIFGLYPYLTIGMTACGMTTKHARLKRQKSFSASTVHALRRPIEGGSALLLCELSSPLRIYGG